jgi:nucleotide-binding universal stress UspA family protein
MFKKILVATDLSSASDHLIACAIGIRRAGAEEAILCHTLGIKYLHDLRFPLERAAEPELLRQKAQLEAQGYRVRVLMPPGLAADDVPASAAAEKVDLVVLGSHVGLGTTTTKILHQLRVPAWSVQSQSPSTAVSTDPFAHVLHPTDFSDSAEIAFERLKRLVQAGAPRVTLLHVQDENENSDQGRHPFAGEFDRIDRRRLERRKCELKQIAACDVRTEIRTGDAVTEIIRGACEASLIVMGSQGKGVISDVFLGSVSHQVARRAAQPVLLEPALAVRWKARERWNPYARMHRFYSTRRQPAGM